MSNLIACVACGGFVNVENTPNFIRSGGRCATCQEGRKLAGKFGSLLVEGALTQRELADLKREFYALYKIDQALDARKKEFMERAMEEMNRVIAEVEGQMGQPIKELRARKQQLEATLKTFMEESQTAELVVRDLLVEVKNTMTNRGNMPQYKAIVEDLRQLLEWSEEEMETFVKQHYSEPQYGNVMTVKPLPPGRRQKKPGNPTAARTVQGTIAEEIERTHREAGGGTFDREGNNLMGQNLFAVPIYPERTATFHRPITARDIEHYMQQNADLLSDPRNKMGTWFDTQMNEHILDVVVAIPDRRLAIELGEKYNQRAIYDLAAKQEIRTGGDGSAPLNMPDPADRLPAPSFGDEGYAQPDMIEKGPVKAYHTAHLDLPTMAVIHTDFINSQASVCKVTTPNDVFIFTGDRVRENGLHTMVKCQTMTKATLKIADVDQRKNGVVHVLLEGTCVGDPNTVRAYLAERIEGYEIADVYYDSPTRVAVELRQAFANEPIDMALAYFDSMLQTVAELTALERRRMETAQQILGHTTAAAGATQVQRPDNDEDLQMAYERAQPAGGSPGSFGDGTRADGGIMGPNDPAGRQQGSQG